ncbi:MAG: DNA-binding protein [Pleurocapsa sp.]
MNTKLAWKIVAVTITSLLFVALAASPVAAEEPFDNVDYSYCCQDNSIRGSRGRYSRSYYNLDRIETLDGKVLSVDTPTFHRGVAQGIHLIVDTGKETVEVHLGPSWYLEDQDFAIAPEDKIAITGSRINFDGEPAIIASQIKKGNDTLVLRDEKGIPLWRGYRQ